MGIVIGKRAGWVDVEVAVPGIDTAQKFRLKFVYRDGGELAELRKADIVAVVDDLKSGGAAEDSVAPKPRVRNDIEHLIVEWEGVGGQDGEWPCTPENIGLAAQDPWFAAAAVGAYLDWVPGARQKN